MSVIALTGGIGAGKSTVAQYFSELGAVVVDADQLARIAIERGSEGFDEVITTFGQSIISNGDIDRKALAAIIFNDPKAKADLEAIIHPRVQRLFAQAVAESDPSIPMIYEIPLLVETDAASKFDFVITVDLADAVIHNDGDEDHLLRQVENLWEGQIADLTSKRSR
jgi:dephospho-CoA kinase